MPTWFAKQVTPANENSSSVPPKLAEIPAANSSASRSRRTIHAPILPSDASGSAARGIRISAQLLSDRKIVLMLDRPVLSGFSYWCASQTEAARWSPLASALFESGGVESVLIHEMNLTITLDGKGQESDDSCARRLGEAIRRHLESGLPAMADSFLAYLPSEEQIREGLQAVIDDKVNPSIAGHSGTITLTAVKGNTAYIKMGGGCQGCSSSSLTLRNGVEQAFRAAVPSLGALLDETDHSAGDNPYFTELPAGGGA